MSRRRLFRRALDFFVVAISSYLSGLRTLSLKIQKYCGDGLVSSIAHLRRLIKEIQTTRLQIFTRIAVLKKFNFPKNFRVGFERSSDRDALRRVFPFQRSWLAIGILAGMDVVFFIPAVVSLTQAIESWQEFETLFDLTVALFTTAWLIGWSVAPIILTVLLYLVWTGREVLKARPGVVELGIGVPGLFLWIEMKADKLYNLRVAKPPENSGTSWRGEHFSVVYCGDRVEFGSAVNAADLSRLKQDIERATGTELQETSEAQQATQEGLATEVAPPLTKKVRRQKDSRKFVENVQPVTLVSISTLFLIVANCVPVFGALYFGWALSDIMVLYWAESAVIGIYNLIKLAIVSRWFIFLVGPFFIGHFGAFMSVHFLFIYFIFVRGGEFSGGGDLAQVANLFIDLWPALFALAVSHGISFWTNFVGRREFENRAVKEQMSAPYRRIVFMHVVILGGGVLVFVLGSPSPVLLLFVALKIVLDVRAHLKDHQSSSAPVGGVSESAVSR